MVKNEGFNASMCHVPAGWDWAGTSVRGFLPAGISRSKTSGIVALGQVAGRGGGGGASDGACEGMIGTARNAIGAGGSGIEATE